MIESIQLGQDMSTPLQQRRQELYGQIDLVVRDHVVQLKTAILVSRSSMRSCALPSPVGFHPASRPNRPSDKPVAGLLTTGALRSPVGLATYA